MRQPKSYTPDELLKRYEKECLQNNQAVQRWKLNHPDRYEAYIKVYQKTYYLENKNRLNALTTERRRQKRIQERATLQSNFV
jgi:hypothetical protein